MSNYVAEPFIAGTQDAQVIGQTMLAFLENLSAEQTRPIMEAHGLSEIDPETWYSHQLWMDVLESIKEEQQGGSMMTFVAIGKEVVRTAVMPDAIQTIPDALHALHAIHHANLRNVPEDEGYQIEEVEDNHYIVLHNTPNPDHAIYGFLWGIAKRFKQEGETFVVKQIDNPSPETARSAFSVRWGADI